ncbi:hypothetical protein [Deferrisoma palaeochoriense]
MPLYDAAGRLVFPEPAPHRAAPPEEPEDLLVDAAFCPRGHPLVRPEHPGFRGKPGIGVWCRAGDRAGLVVLSPFGGDKRKVCEVEFPIGTVVEVASPACREPLPLLAPHDCRPGASYVALFLRPEPDWTQVLALCNAWGCPAAFLRRGDRVVAEFQSRVLPDPLPDLPQAGGVKTP